MEGRPATDWSSVRRRRRWFDYSGLVNIVMIGVINNNNGGRGIIAVREP